MNKLYLSSALIAIFALPAFADIDKSASTATCDSATIGATSGTAYMDTDWTANTINLDFYSDGEKISTGSCTYDGAIELPEDPEDKTGYTFGGWQLRRALVQTTFDLSTWTYGDAIDDGYQNDSTGQYGADSRNTETYGINGDQQWATEFANGTVRGVSYCSAKDGNIHNGYWGGNASDWTSTESELTNASGDKKNCWCKATGIDTEKDGNYVSVGTLYWVRSDYRSNVPYCAKWCAAVCADYVRDNANFRSAVFGVTQ